MAFLGGVAFLPIALAVQAAAPPAHAPVADAGKPASVCSERQVVVLDSRSGWQCVASVMAGQAYLVRVEQRDVDVLVTLTGPKGEEVLAVDAPTKRASPELALIGPQLAGKYVVSVQPKDADAPVARAEVAVTRLPETGVSPLARGLKELTRSAVRGEKQTLENAESSIVQLKAAIGELRTAGAARYEAEALLRIAALDFWVINDWSKAAAAAAEAMEAFTRLEGPVMHSHAATLRGASLVEIANAMKQPGRRGATPGQSQFDEAMQLLRSAAGEFESAGMPYHQAQAINYLGIAHYYQADYSGARATYLQAARILEALGERSSEALPRQNIAMIDRDEGNYAKAIDSYSALLRVLSPQSDPGYYMSVLLNLGNLQYVMGDFDRALQSFMAALQLSEEKEFVAEQARSLHGLGLVYLAIGERDRASIFLERALAIRRSLAKQDPRGLQTSRIRVGDLKRENGDVRGALELHLEALDYALSVTQKARALYAIGQDHEAGDVLNAAMQAYESALKLPLPEDWPTRVSVLGAYGRTKLLAGDPSGRELTQKAARLHESRGDDDLAAQAFLALATDDSGHDRLDAALANINKSIALFETQRLRAVNPDLRATYLATRAAAIELQGDVYGTQWQRAVESKEKRRIQNQALRAIDANRRRAVEDFREMARAASVGAASLAANDDVFALDGQLAAKRHRLATVMEQPNPSPETIEMLRTDISLLRTRLDVSQSRSDAARGGRSEGSESSAREAVPALSMEADAALLVYQLGEVRSWLWCVTREATRAFELPARREIESAARTLYAVWSKPGAGGDISAVERAASKTILGAAATILRDHHTVTVVPDGILRSIPFGALLLDAVTAGKSERMAENHAVIFRSTPGRGPANDAVAGEASRNRILLIGDPSVANASARARREALADPWSWQSLPGTRREVEAIAGIASDWRSYVLLGAQATKPALLSMPLDTFRAIHFATHARLDVNDPQLSSIALSSREASFAASSSTLTVREILGFKLQAETVVLSACEASLGKSYRGQLSFGLSEAFLLAGAHNVLGSLWRVSDEATQEYMRHFYEQYVRHDASPAAAAQFATRKLAQDPAFAHPYFWAAFVVTQK